MAKTSSDVELESLAPRYVEEQHATYLKRLEEAVGNSINYNIALTGRYGAGKSSVLEKFEENATKIRRLAISSLGPNDEGATLTNRIQKEIVKQLVYSASPQTLSHSRFRRNIALPKKRAIGEAIVVVGLAALFLTLLGWLPAVAGTGPDHHWITRLSAWIGLTVLSVAAVTMVRLTTYNRFVLSDVSPLCQPYVRHPGLRGLACRA